MFALRTLLLAPLIFLTLPGFVGRTVAAHSANDQNSVKQLGYLGVAVASLDRETAQQSGLSNTQGALVHGVWPDSPAAKAGLQPDDVILAVNNKQISGIVEFGQLVADLAPHHKVRLAIIRDGKKITLTAILGARSGVPRSPEPPTRIEILTPGPFFGDMPSPALRWRNSLLGVEYESIDSQLADFFGVKQGVLIRYVHPGSLAGAAGLKAGDVVVKVNEKITGEARNIALALQNRQPGQSELTLELVRGHKSRAIRIKIGNTDSRLP